jgi:hypothetical protein
LAKALHDEELGRIQTSSNNQNGGHYGRIIGRSRCHIKFIFGWKVMNNGLATQDNKKCRRIIETSTCEVCGMELVMHALVSCGHAMALRAAMR